MKDRKRARLNDDPAGARIASIFVYASPSPVTAQRTRPVAPAPRRSRWAVHRKPFVLAERWQRICSADGVRTCSAGLAPYIASPGFELHHPSGSVAASAPPAPRTMTRSTGTSRDERSRFGVGGGDAPVPESDTIRASAAWATWSRPCSGRTGAGLAARRRAIESGVSWDMGSGLREHCFRTGLGARAEQPFKSSPRSMEANREHGGGASEHAGGVCDRKLLPSHERQHLTIGRPQLRPCLPQPMVVVRPVGRA